MPKERPPSSRDTNAKRREAKRMLVQLEKQRDAAAAAADADRSMTNIMALMAAVTKVHVVEDALRLYDTGISTCRLGDDDITTIVLKLANAHRQALAAKTMEDELRGQTGLAGSERHKQHNQFILMADLCQLYAYQLRRRGVPAEQIQGQPYAHNVRS